MIEVRSASRTFAMGSTEVRALRGVDLRIEDGEFVAIMGPSGSGKSTLMYLLGALDKPSAGSVLHGNEDVAGCDSNGLADLRGRRIGFVFQMFSLMPTLSAFDNVELPMVFQRVPRVKRKARAAELLALVGMAERAGHLPSELSGGEQQRVAIARALANQPDLLLADEPTGNLDSKTGEQIIDLLKTLNGDGGMTIVLVTHDTAVASHADRIVRLWDGVVFSSGESGREDGAEAALGAPSAVGAAGDGGHPGDIGIPPRYSGGKHVREASEQDASRVDEQVGLGERAEGHFAHGPDQYGGEHGKDGAETAPSSLGGASEPRNHPEGGGSHA